jgi:hypothetical protein
MATEFATELDRQLEDCKTALRDQAQAMLVILAEFESQVKARLDAAEAKMATIREFESTTNAPTPIHRRASSDR